MEAEIQKSPENSGFAETATTSLSMLRAGALLAGRYRILGVVGAGGMGVVYRAQDEELGVPLAIKALRSRRGDDARKLERFREEIRLARKVSHQNVVRIHDIGQDGDLLFLTMDYVEGRTLRELLADGPLPVQQAVGFARCLAEALAAAHEQGVIHRDVKPDNVIASETGRAWLTDFGVARAMEGGRLTLDGGVLGTVNYLAPEQVRGEPVDGRTDIYALGIVLYEMLCGDVPLRGDTIEETTARRAAGRTVDVAALKSAPAGLKRIIARCLEPKPEDRYATAAELAADLSRGGAALQLRKGFVRAGAVVAALSLAAVLAFAALRFIQPSVPAETVQAEAAQRIAVLPFANNTGLEDYDWIRRGLPESIAASLAENPGIRVVDSLRVFQTIEALRIAGSNASGAELRQVAALLDVTVVVSGALVGDEQERRLEFTARRLPEGVDQHVRSEIGAGGVLAATDAGVAKLLDLLQIRPEESAVAPRLSESEAAMAAYDEGVALLSTGESVLAIDRLGESVKADPQFGLAWNALVRAYSDAGRRNEAIDAASKAAALFDKQGGRAALQAKAQQAILAGESEDGVVFLEQLVDRYPNDVSGRMLLAEQLGDLGRFEEAQAQLQKVVAADPNHPRAWFLRGKFAAISGDPKTAAEDYYVRALVIQNRLGSTQGRGEVFNAMGIAHEQLGDLNVARQYYRNAIEMRTVANDSRGLAGSLANVARLDAIQGDFKSARDSLEKSLEVLGEIGDLNGIASMQNEFGLLEEEAGDYASALVRYREAMRIRRELGDKLDLAESYVNVAFTYLVLGDYDNAAAYARNAYEAFDAVGSERGRLQAREIQSELGIARGEWSTALNALVSNLESSRAADNPFSEAVAEGGLGLVAYYQGRPKAALEAWDRALEILKPLEDFRGIAEYELRKADLLLSLPSPDEAKTILEGASSYLDEAGSIAQRAEFQRLQGELAALEGRRDEASAYFSRASELATRSGSVPLILKADLSASMWLKDREDSQSIASRASSLGSAPLRLEALALLAESQLDTGDYSSAYATAMKAAKPPTGLELWRDNWRLNLLAAKAAEKAAPEEADRLRENAASQLASLIEATPANLRSGLLSRQAAEGLDVSRP